MLDFSWFLFVGHTLLKFSEKEIGRMTVRKFLKLYDHYKDNFDLELKMKSNNITYSQLAKLQEKNGGDGEWL